MAHAVLTDCTVQRHTSLAGLRGDAGAHRLRAEEDETKSPRAPGPRSANLAQGSAVLCHHDSVGLPVQVWCLSPVPPRRAHLCVLRPAGRPTGLGQAMETCRHADIEAWRHGLMSCPPTFCHRVPRLCRDLIERRFCTSRLPEHRLASLLHPVKH